MRPSLLFLAFCSTTLLPDTASAQLRGMAGAWGSGMSLDDNQPLDKFHFKAAGDQTSPPPVAAIPPAQVGSNLPDFRLATMFSGYASDVEIDALSTGNDLMLVDGQGRINVQNRWAAVTVSVNRYAQGGSGSYLEGRRQTSTLGVGADVFTYYDALSSGIGQGLAGEVWGEQTAEQMGFTVDTEIDAFDWFAPFMQTGLNDTTAIVVPSTTVYFSITTDSADALVSHSSQFGGSTPSGANIYSMTWQQDALGTWGWSPIQIYKSHSQLGLLSTDELDAVGVNPLYQVVVFSTNADTSTFGSTQLMVISSLTGGSTPLLDSAGFPVVEKLGLTTEDDVDAVCDFDPEILTLSQCIGIPSQAQPGAPMSISATREINPVSGEHEIVVGIYRGKDLAGLGPHTLSLLGIDYALVNPLSVLETATWAVNETRIEFRKSVSSLITTMFPNDSSPSFDIFLGGLLDPANLSLFSWATTIRL